MTNGTEILLIEDNAEDVEITLRAFRKYQLANKIHVVRDGEEALECLFGTGRYADRTLCSNTRLILLDLKLPKVDGLEILQRCKSDPRTKNIPVVILTSSREDRDLIESYKLGVIDSQSSGTRHIALPGKLLAHDRIDTGGRFRGLRFLTASTKHHRFSF